LVHKIFGGHRFLSTGFFGGGLMGFLAGLSENGGWGFLAIITKDFW